MAKTPYNCAIFKKLILPRLGHNLRDGARLSIQGHTCNGAGMCYSREDQSYPHKVDTSPPSMPRIRRVMSGDGEISVSIAGVEEVAHQKSNKTTL